MVQVSSESVAGITKCIFMVPVPFKEQTFLLAVLLVADLFHSLGILVVENFLNGDVRQRSGLGRAVPVLHVGWKPHHIAGLHLVFLAVPFRYPTLAGCDRQRLSEWMGVPGGPRTGSKVTNPAEVREGVWG